MHTICAYVRIYVYDLYGLCIYIYIDRYIDRYSRHSQKTGSCGVTQKKRASKIVDSSTKTFFSNYDEKTSNVEKKSGEERGEKASHGVRYRFAAFLWRTPGKLPVFFKTPPQKFAVSIFETSPIAPINKRYIYYKRCQRTKYFGDSTVDILYLYVYVIHVSEQIHIPMREVLGGVCKCVSRLLQSVTHCCGPLL